LNNFTPRDRLIFALDVDNQADALAWIDRLGDSINFYKIGMELLTSGDYFHVLNLLAERGKRVFVDLKFFDVPATVAAAVKGLSRYPVSFCTIHGNDAMMRAAAEVKAQMQILAVTALTSLDQRDLTDLGFQCDARTLVCARARAAVECGMDGVVASGQEAADIRAAVGDKLMIVCPGIRPIANTDDQKRVVDAKQAFENGADFIVVGRPIRLANDPRLAAENLQSTIAEALATRAAL